MSEALLVLNPRHIPECIDAIKGLGIPTCWLSYMNEAYAADRANEIIRTTSFDRYLVLADDTIPTQEALDLVLREADQGHPVVTGYCNLDEGDYADIVNLTTNTLPPPPAASTSYHFMTRTQVEQNTGNAIPTTFAGLALTLATRQVWLDHPLQVEPSTGGQMDYDLSYRLAKSGIPLVAAVGAYVHHVKERWSHADRNPEKRLLIGQRKPKVHWTGLEVTA
jgi:hypothetical protein